MKKTINKALSWLLSVVMVFGMVVAVATLNVEAINQSEFDIKLNQLRSQYPDYSTWNDYFDGGHQCYGFARLVAYNVFGSHADDWNKSTSINDVKAGDVLQYGDTSGSGHTVFVTSVSGSTIYFVDCNGNGNYSNGDKVRSCAIKWDNSISKLGAMFNKYSFSYRLIAPDSHNPIGYLDGVDSPAPNKIHVHGWAADWDNVGEPLVLHVYVGGPVGTGAPGYPITANKYRSDVNNDHPGIGEYHGFDATIPVEVTGNKDIYVYAINIGSGDNNPLLTNCPKTVNIQNDTEKPVISNVKVTEVSDSGYRLTCNVTDNCAIKDVKFPTWTVNNDQDDLIWHDASVSGNTATFYIKSSEHKGETGTYYTDIYAYDFAGNFCGARVIVPQLTPYTIKYNLNGGTGSFSDQKKYYSATIRLNSATPKKTGYTFVCWNTKSDGTGKNYYPNNDFSDNADTTLYAVWKANTYTITYNSNGGSGTVNPSSVTFGQKFTLPGSGFTKSGYTLTGFNVYRKSDNTWCVNNQGWVTESQIKDGNSKKEYGVNTSWWLENSWVNSNAGNDTLTFYAVWTPAKPSATTVSVVAGSSSEPTLFSWTKSANAKSYNLKVYKDKKWEGELKAVWTVSDLSCPVQLSAGYYEAYVDAVNDYGYTMSTNVVKFTVKESTYTISYSFNGGTGEEIPDQIKIHDSPVTLSSTIPVRKGFDFVGWSTEDSAYDAKYQPEDTYNVNADLSLYAVWRKKLTNNTTISSNAIALGKDITINSGAEGGTAPYKYAYYYKRSTDSVWTRVYTTPAGYAYTKNTEMTFKPTSAGTYNIRINVKDNNGTGTMVSKEFTVKVTASEVLKNNSTVSATSVTANTEVTLNGKASGGTSPYKYAYYYKKSTDSAWTRIYTTPAGYAYTKNTEMIFKPTAAGTYNIRINVKDENGTGTMVSKDFTVKVTSDAALKNNSTVSATTVTAGTTVTMTGKATGGTAPYKFAYYYKKSTDSAWTKAYVTSSGSAYTKYDTMTFTPNTAGTYNVRINVKDNNGTGTAISKDFTVTVK